MKHSSTQDLYRYWNRRRGERPAPERADIDPTAIPRVLADTFLLGMNASGSLVFRLAGTRVCALFCRELKGESFVALFGRDNRQQVEDLLDIVCDEPVATIAGARARLGDGAAAELELLLLPLRYHGRTDSRILGVLAALSPSYWIGAIPVASLTLGSLRHVGPFADPATTTPRLRSARNRHGFVVYDGGRR